jgi:hypothetical protein
MNDAKNKVCRIEENLTFITVLGLSNIQVSAQQQKYEKRDCSVLTFVYWQINGKGYLDLVF